MSSAGFRVEEYGDFVTIYCYGEWRVSTIDRFENKIYTLKPKSRVIIDLKELRGIDTSGALLLIAIENRSKGEFEYRNIAPKVKQLITLLKRKPQVIAKANLKPKDFLQRVIEKIDQFFEYKRAFLAFIGELFMKSIALFWKPKQFRLKETIYFIQSAGINALPIIGMTAFLVGVVIAYQTIVQLTKFGADIFVVDTSTIAITRELGPMITAIVVAGRSASSFAAEIGAMKLTDEIDAMKTMGFMPFYFLVIPRIVALVIALPLLIFFSDIVGIFGAMVVTKSQIGLSFEQFIQRVYEVLSLKHYLVGIFKGPFFALLIAITGVFHGLKVSRDTESIGKETTQSVVNAIFFVIICDAIFSVIFTELGI